MGSFQYVVANSDLQVALCHNRAAAAVAVAGHGNSGGGGGGGGSGCDVRVVKERGGYNGNSSIDGDAEGKKISIGSKGESFSVSKIWLWSKKGKYPSSLDTHMGTSVNVGLPWNDTTQGT
ncbi:hypothetical protein L1049_007273 [Liquidambar formosana]|uniref:Uncharacterized protein n=1 Tax=Liquidambar formosana TaxID=63359 RepID=A0AAP0RKE3_LIQFO